MGRQAARVGAGLALLAVTLTACGGDADDPATGTPASAQSASAEASPEPSGSKDAVSSEGASGSSTASPEASGGSFVPASSEGPAQNVPVPEMPAAAKEQTQEGLEAALEYWWEAAYYLKSTGDSLPMERVSMNGCVVCQDLIKNWPLAYEDGVWAVVEPAELDIAVSNLENSEYGTLLFTATERATTVYAPDGTRMEEASTEEIPKAPWSGSARYSGEDGHWQIEQFVPQEQE